MSLQRQQTFLVRLFTEEKLRQNFLMNPEKIGHENGLEKNDILQLKEILPEQLSFFADSLFYKRVHEAEKLLPLTSKVLNVQFTKLFRGFSQTFTPKTVKKHLEDAIEFVNYLNKESLEIHWLHDLAKFEQTQLIFNGYNKSFILQKFSFDIRQIVKEISHHQKVWQNEFQPRKTMAIWLRFGKKNKHFII